MKRFVATVALVASALVSVSLASAQDQGAMIEWPYVGAEQAHTKYSPAEDLSAANVDELEIVWQWEPKEKPLEKYGTRPRPFQVAPIMVDNVLYLSTMYTRVVALDAETGAEVWRGATPYKTYANPMTYRARSGRQVIVIATGRSSDAALVAFARPR